MLKRIGPGIILTGVVIGPGNITTSAMLGANYGYGLIWLWIPIAFMGITFMLTSYRISMLTGRPILHAIRHYYGSTASAVTGVALFLSCLFLPWEMDWNRHGHEPDVRHRLENRSCHHAGYFCCTATSQRGYTARWKRGLWSVLLP